VRSSNPTASAQPISRPSAFQPGSRRQACHLLPIVMPMPKPELVSEKASRSVRGTGPGMFLDREGELRRLVHHLRSSGVLQGGVCGTKGLLLNPESMASRLVRYARPAGMTREMWSNLPYNPCTSAKACVGFFFHSSIALRYLIFFSSGIATVRASRSQTKPSRGPRIQRECSWILPRVCPMFLRGCRCRCQCM